VSELIRCECNKLLCTKDKCKTTVHNQSVQNMQANIEAVDDDHCRIEIKCPKCGKINGIIV